MKLHYTLVILLGLLLTLPGAPGPASAQTDSPLIFIENNGQFAPDIRFQAYGANAAMALTDDALWFTLVEPTPLDPENPAPPTEGVSLRLSFPGSAPAQLEPFDPRHTRTSFFTSPDPAQWQTGLPAWGGVRYVDFYPGLDLVVTSQNGQLALQLMVKTIEALDLVAMQIEGAAAVNLAGNTIQLTTPLGEYFLPLLQVVWLAGPAPEQPQPPTLSGNRITAPFADPAAEPLTAQAISAADAADLIYSTFLGGVGNMDGATDMVVDAAGYAYVTGQAYFDFPSTPGVFDPGTGGVESELFILKLSPDGSTLEYGTFVGGRDFDIGQGLAVDEAGNVYVAGFTKSDDFPTTPGAFATTFAGGSDQSDAFVAKLNADATDLIYSTYLGGFGTELCWDLAVDSAGRAYLTGSTDAVDFPTTPGAFDGSLDSWYDAFVARFNADASALEYSTFIGGDNADYSQAIAIDSAGNAYITGYTHSANFPVTPDAADSSYDAQEIFIAKLNNDGSTLSYASFLGGSDSEYATDIAVDDTGHIYLTGTTRSTDFPVTAGAFDTSYNTTADYSGDAFLLRLLPDARTIDFATYLGGQNNDLAQGLALAADGGIYVTGYTESPDFLTTPDAFDTVCEDCSATFPPPDGFLVKVTADGASLTYGTFFGGTGYDRPAAVAEDGAGYVYLAGTTSSVDFPTTPAAFDIIHDGFNDGFAAKLLPTLSELPPPTPTPEPEPVPDHGCAPTPLGTIAVGNTPRGLAVDAAKERVYVANSGSNSVSVIDSRTNTVITTIPNLPGATGIAHDGMHHMLWVTNYTTNQVTPIEINDDATVFTPQSPVDVGAGPWGAVYNVTYGQVHVANSLDDSVSVIDVASRAVVATLTGDFSQPHHLAYNIITGKVYAANFGNASVTVINGSTVERVVSLYDSGQPYGLAVDEQRSLVYIATVAPHRIVVLGTLHGQPDKFLGWAEFYRGFGDRNRPVPLRVIAVNPDIGPFGDGGHVWSTTSTTDFSETNQALLIPKGWSSYFHYPLAHNVDGPPTDGIGIDRQTDRVYVSSGTSAGFVTVIGDHATLCGGIAPASLSAEETPTAEQPAEFDFEIYTQTHRHQGDVTGDGRVNMVDLVQIAARYGSADPAADVNGDGVVNMLDLVTAARNYGKALTD